MIIFCYNNLLGWLICITSSTRDSNNETGDHHGQNNEASARNGWRRSADDVRYGFRGCPERFSSEWNNQRQHPVLLRQQSGRGCLGGCRERHGRVCLAHERRHRWKELHLHPVPDQQVHPSRRVQWHVEQLGFVDDESQGERQLLQLGVLLQLHHVVLLRPVVTLI